MTESKSTDNKGPALYRKSLILISVSLVAFMGSLTGLALGKMVAGIIKPNKPATVQRTRIIIGTIIVTGDYQKFIEMGLKSELFKLQAEQNVVDGPQFVFRVQNGQVEGWLDQRPGVALVSPPLFTLEFKPKDPANPTAEEIMAISSDILIKISKYTVILPVEA